MRLGRQRVPLRAPRVGCEEGGLHDPGDPTHESAREIYYLNAYSPDALVVGDRLRLKARDIVDVETAPVTRWSRVIEPGALGRAIPSSRATWAMKGRSYGAAAHRAAFEAGERFNGCLEMD